MSDSRSRRPVPGRRWLRPVVAPAMAVALIGGLISAAAPGAQAHPAASRAPALASAPNNAATAATAAAAASLAATVPGAYTAVTPTRVLDTRDGTGAPIGAVGAGSTTSVQVAGKGGVPATGVSGVVLNVTVTQPQTGGWIAAFASQAPNPVTSNLNYNAGQTVPNLVIVPVSSTGSLRLLNGSPGTTQLIADVFGYFLGGTPSAAGTFSGLAQPARVLDTRAGIGAAAAPVGALSTTTVQLTGAPATASSVVLNLTVTSPTGTGDLRAFAAGGSIPGTSNVNFTPGQTVPNLVVVPISTDKKVSVYNDSTGTANLIADVFGYFLGGTPSAVGSFAPVAPTRVMDTRDGTNVAAGAAAARSTTTFQVTGHGGVPNTGVASVVLNLTVTQPTQGGDVRAFAGGTSVPGTSNVNFVPGQSVPNLVVVPVSSAGTVSFYNDSFGSTQLIADVFGYVLAPAVPQYDHIVVVMEENHSYSDIIGAPNTPAEMQAHFINDELAPEGATFTNSHAIEHPSQPNYLDLFSGSNQGVTDDNCGYMFSTANLGSQLPGQFTGYAEDLPSTVPTPCTSGAFAARHAPWLSFNNVPPSASKSMSQFPNTDTQFSALPKLSFVIPNLNDDMHDGTIAQGDDWLDVNLASYAAWAQQNNSLLIVTFDEDDYSEANQIPTIFAGAHVTQNLFTDEPIDHFNVLRTIEAGLGLPAIGTAANRQAISSIWGG